jgi:hypothetical protein
MKKQPIRITFTGFEWRVKLPFYHSFLFDKCQKSDLALARIGTDLAMSLYTFPVNIDPMDDHAGQKVSGVLVIDDVPVL